MKTSRHPQPATIFQKVDDLISKMVSIRLLSIALLVLIPILVFHNSLSNGFVYDDYAVIVENKFLKLPGINVSAFFNHSYFSIAGGESSYRPISTLSYYLLYNIGGLNPFYYHLLSVVLHILTVILVYLLAGFILKSRWMALISGLLFACHPVVTEPVNCISYNEDLLVAFFFLLALLCYLKKEALNGRSGVIIYALSLFFFLLGLFSKEMAITLPVIIVLCDLSTNYADNRPFSLKLLLCTIKDRWHLYSGYLAVSLFFLIIQFFVLFHPQKSLTPNYGSLMERVIYLPNHIFSFLKLAILPINLTPDYVFSYPSSFFDIINIVGFSVVLGLVVFSLWIYKYSTQIFFGIWWFIITLFPVYNLIPIYNPFAERYLYLPLIGLCIAVAYSLAEVLHRVLSQPGLARILTLLVTTVVLSLYSSATIARNREWNSGLTLWSKAVSTTPNSSIAHGSLGQAYQADGRMEEAIREYEKAIDIYPKNYKAYYNLGVLYDGQKDLAKAVQNYKHAIAINPKFVNAHFNLGNIYFNQGILDDAIYHYTKVIEISPDDYEARNNLGVAYAKQGNLDAAIAQWEKVLKIDPLNKSVEENISKAKEMRN